MGTLALAWVLRQPAIDAAILGPRTAQHLDAAIAALAVDLTHADVQRIGGLFEAQ